MSLGRAAPSRLDISFNGEYTPRSISAFYSFGYRLAHRFSMPALLGRSEDLIVPQGFWSAFFRGAVPAVGAPAVRPAPSPSTAWDSST